MNGFRPLAGNRYHKRLTVCAYVASIDVSVPLRGIGITNGRLRGYYEGTFKVSVPLRGIGITNGVKIMKISREKTFRPLAGNRYHKRLTGNTMTYKEEIFPSPCGE